MSNDKDLHPSEMSREELEKELLAHRVMAGAWAEIIESGDAQITHEGKARLMAARATVNMIYGMA